MVKSTKSQVAIVGAAFLLVFSAAALAQPPLGEGSPPVQGGIPPLFSAEFLQPWLKLGAAAASPQEGTGKCEVDSPAVPAQTSAGATVQGRCDDPENINADTAERDQCRAAADLAWKQCGAACGQFRKRDLESEEAEPTRDPCRRDNLGSLIATVPMRVQRIDAGRPVCEISCRAEIVCKCDP